MYFRILNDGSPTLTMNGQTSTDAYYYEAFGNITSQAGTTVNPFRYVGALGYYWFDCAHHKPDRTSSLLHVGTRYYSPQVGRFWTQDPIGADVNLYPYVSSNPVNSADPDGQFIIAPVICLMLGILGAGRVLVSLRLRCAKRDAIAAAAAKR
jgi:RHS repeat-associated protein